MQIKNVLPKSHYKLQSRNSTHHHNQPCSSRSPPSELPFVQPPILTDAALLAAVGRAQLPADQSTTSGKEKGNTCKMMKPRRTRGHLRLLFRCCRLHMSSKCLCQSDWTVQCNGKRLRLFCTVRQNEKS